ncbi:uncharacterized protein BCR38DRAFT_481036 [Pseudomassariella vexata]|uniref:Uncharacterized protein n=1 Tax=Pseudomassariella vexata TaxID=1141098 RepID=A0A1Y2EEY5_9PEZI|nr:uncharacterized protein BCR38DRAFT_481036 [Pseudomassariella vexata]ORY69874.1 hypothetical protein BCR38DRAFT_481036 [Pseudomassariella vexata]
MERILLSRALQAPFGLRAAMTTPTRQAMHVSSVRHASSAPSIVQTSFWKSLIPKPLRRRKQPSVDWGTPDYGVKKKPKSKEWNPATFYIVIFMFIGSMSIQMIALRKDFNTFMRRSDTRIGVLREVVDKLQRGEEVDVEKALGTGDAEKEQEWEAVLREIERDDALRNSRKGEKSKQAALTKVGTEVDDIKAQQTPAATATKTEPTKEKAATSYSSFF